MTYFLIFAVLAMGIVILLQKYTKLEFVNHAKLLWKTWSVWLSGVGATLSAVFMAFPDAALNMWMILPPDIKTMLPPVVVQLLGPFMVVMGVASQYVKQHKLAEERQRLEKQ
jgi:hypothetical protein